MRTFGQCRRMRWMTCQSTRAISSPDGRLPGLSSERTGLPEVASKIWMGAGSNVRRRGCWTRRVAGRRAPSRRCRRCRARYCWVASRTREGLGEAL